MMECAQHTTATGSVEGEGCGKRTTRLRCRGWLTTSASCLHLAIRGQAVVSQSGPICTVDLAELEFLELLVAAERCKRDAHIAPQHNLLAEAPSISRSLAMQSSRRTAERSRGRRAQAGWQAGSLASQPQLQAEQPASAPPTAPTKQQPGRQQKQRLRQQQQQTLQQQTE
jgi:hypothetical protein